MNPTLWLPVLAGLAVLGGVFIGWALREHYVASMWRGYADLRRLDSRDNPNPEDQGA